MKIDTIDLNNMLSSLKNLPPKNTINKVFSITTGVSKDTFVIVNARYDMTVPAKAKNPTIKG